ncbi:MULTISPECIES: hypothetical protein [unclassified Curtobacterium]|uniref:hypothetical protein n=1 Tax=unclassified Curtobacterium TaxID=257496 RepID=UPI000DA84C23|nr:MULTISPECIES: hypothetical protein [unclassified Curtobacterium]PZE23241.1 hypothetical protein DEI86_14950 [Curtobacterium sp. MCBD17_028]WIB63102.1 hypothetical protein DEI94_13225 [Curtobacterium sp. MCBD17_040]WIB66953.1 hypothetical protein DEI93_13455 [Curtobacterium sp. MCBD17_035]WIE54092.1 hypothetical protein DEI88_013335 [Curtobacterium sp. MCBD17_003]
MNATVPVTSVHPVERAAHRIGLGLVHWSTARADRRARRLARVAVTTPAPRVLHERAAVLHHASLDREARERSWERLASAQPRLR